MRFGGLLPYPIRLVNGKGFTVVNENGAPWRRRAKPAELLEFGRQAFEINFVDVIPLRSKVGGVDGLAFVLPFSPSLK